MTLPENLLKFIKKTFVYRRDDILCSFFWNFIVIGLFLLPLGINVSTPCFIAAIILGFLNVIKKRKVLDRKDLIFLSFPLLYLLLATSLTYTSDLNTGVSQLERLVPIFCFPIIFLFVKEDETIVTKMINALFVGVLISFVYNVYGAFCNSFQNDGSGFVWDTSVAGGYSFFESFSHGGSYFIGANFSEHVHPSYIALYILVLLVFCYRSKTGWFKNFSLTLLLLYLFLLASRGAFILLFALLALYIFEGSDYQVRLKRLGFLLIAGVLLVGLNPRIKILDERISDFFNKKNYNYTTSEQSRILIYRSSSNLIAKAPFFGYGIGDADQELLKEYIRAKYLKNSEGRYNAHNQYLQTTLQVGLFGLIFLAAPFAFLLTRRRSIYSLAMTLVMGGFLVFESMLVRYNGIIFFAVFIPILLRKSNALFRTSNLE